VATSSTKKAAKLTQRSKGKKVRFQGGTVFPFAVALVLVLGLATIVYARQSVPAADSSPPTIEDHWHAAYGFYVCGEWYQLAGNAEEVNSQGQLANTDYLRTGVHSHDDGVIHWHPFTAAAVGTRAKLGVFLDVYGVELSDESIKFPAGQPSPALPADFPDGELVEGEQQCAGEDGEVSVVVWENFSDTDDGVTYISNFDQIRVANDGMVFSIAFVPRDTSVPMPPWAADLPSLGAVDAGQIPPDQILGGTTTVAGSTGSTTPGATVPAGSVAPSSATTPATTAPAP
jgi:hypothetical protein